MKPTISTAIALLAFVALVSACGKKRNQRADIVECSSISLDAKGTTQCLVQLHGWKVAEATRAAQNRQRELDSLKAWREDSAWAVESAKHKNDLKNCQKTPDQFINCLLVAGWPLKRVEATSDSVWNADLPKHKRELQACMAKRDVNLSSCLTLYYKWESDRAIATADSVARARLGGRH
jgi:hypothetical protein